MCIKGEKNTRIHTFSNFNMSTLPKSTFVSHGIAKHSINVILNYNIYLFI